jgi:hypothetical protein
MAVPFITSERCNALACRPISLHVRSIDIGALLGVRGPTNPANQLLLAS